MTIVPVTDASTCGLYTKCMICMLQVGVQCAGIICTIACYGIGTINTDCDCQHGISYYRIYRSRLGVSDMDCFCRILFLSFLPSKFQFAFLCMSAVHGEFDWRILQFSNCLLTISA